MGIFGYEFENSEIFSLFEKEQTSFDCFLVYKQKYNFMISIICIISVI